MTKRALLIGINYYAQDCSLKGCINDIIDIFLLLIKLGYTEFYCLYDGVYRDEFNAQHTIYTMLTGYPNKNTIISGIDWLISKSNTGDKLFLHYSGHGTINNLNNQTAIVPVDYKINGVIDNDFLRLLLINPLLNTKISLYAIFDCCNSGKLLNLPYNYKISQTLLQPPQKQIEYNETLDSSLHTVIKNECYKYFDVCLVNKHFSNNNIITENLIADIVKDTIKMEYLKYFIPSIVNNILNKPTTDNNTIHFEIVNEHDTSKTYLYNQDIYKINQPEDTQPDIILISGCNENQTSADTVFKKPNGALTANFCYLYNNFLTNNNTMDIHISTLLYNLHNLLKQQHFTQIPQISSKIEIHQNSLFNL